MTTTQRLSEMSVPLNVKSRFFVTWNIGFYGSRHCHGRPVPYHRNLISQKHGRLVAQGDQQFIMGHQEHNRRWKVWIDVMRVCYEMCHAL